MKIEIDTLFAADKTPLAKSFYMEDNEIKVHSYPHVKYFNSVRLNPEGVEGLAETVKEVGLQGGCLLKGLLRRTLVNETRAGHTRPDASTRWMCLDIDGLKGVDSVDGFIQLLPEPFHQTSYVIQYSSSMGIIDKGLSAHVFMFIEETEAATLKRWLMWQNLTSPILKLQLGLTRSQVALRYALDVTTCQNDKLLYVAPPHKSAGVLDTWGEDRVQVVKKRYVRLPEYDFYTATPEETQLLNQDTMDEIRDNLGMPSQKHEMRKIGSVEVLKDVRHKIEITGNRQDRGFTYLNLNGGDSWGYYHPDDNAKVLYNFKGEPNLSIEDVFPGYYERCTNGSATVLQGDAPAGETNTVESEPTGEAVPADGLAAEAEGTSEPTGSGWITLVGIDARSGGYFGLRYQSESDEFGFTTIGQRIQIKDYCHQYGVPAPDRLQRWEIGYDFGDFTYKIDEDNHYINLYHPPDHFRRASTTDVGGVPATIARVLQHVVGDDQEAYELLLNWLACVVQYRRAIGTAWLLSGTQGTGKGLFFMNILMPILGRDYVARATLPVFEKEFNSFMEQSLLVFVDEIRLKDLKNSSAALSNLKQLITDHQISIRRMRTDPYMVTNHANFIFASNHYDSMEIDPSDRRFLVAPRQEKPLTQALSIEHIESDISAELPGFASHLFGRTADLQLARRMYHSSERQRLKHLTRTASDEVADAIREGDAGFFVFEAPDKDRPGDAAVQAKLPEPIAYQKFLRLVFESDGQPIHIPRDMLRMVWWQVTGAWFQTPTKFSKFVGRLGLTITRVRVGNNIIAGLKATNWNVTPEARQEYVRWLANQESHLSPVPTTSSTSKSTEPGKS